MDSRVRRALARLKRDYPLDLPVKVTTYPELINYDCDRIYGAMAKRENVFHIYLLRHTDFSVEIESLWHEWTHCLLWPRCQVRHSTRFWTTYGQIYSRYQD